MKRVSLLILTNLAVLVTLSVAVHLLGLNTWLTASGIDMPRLLGFCAIFGFGGAAISLLISKPMAKWATGAQVVTGQENASTAWLVATVEELAYRAGIRPPEVAVYEGAPNAFATGAFKNSALVAVSTGLLDYMSKDQVRAVLAHEVAHISNGDMVSLSLLQGVVNTFVMAAARVVGNLVDRTIFRNEEDAPGLGYALTVVVLELVFGILASVVVMAFSRHREYRADWGAAELLGTARPMQDALRVLAGASSDLPKSVAAFGIASKGSIATWLSSHPSIESRLDALDQFGR